MRAPESGDAFPRPLGAGVWWLGDCNRQKHLGQWVHSYTSVYLVHGERASAIVDTGTVKDWEAIDAQLDALLARPEIPPVRFVLPTHAEVPHSSNLERLLDKFPAAAMHGDVRDYHYAFPRVADRLRPCAVGGALDLGGSAMLAVPAVVSDSETSLWWFHTGTSTLFPADAIGMMHHHARGECGLFAEQMPELPLPEFAANFALFALHWTRFVDVRPLLERLDALLAEHPPAWVATAHGAPLSDPARSIPLFKQGLVISSPTSTLEAEDELRGYEIVRAQP